MQTRWKPLFIQLCGQIFIVGSVLTAMIAATFILNPNVFGQSEVTIQPAPKIVALPFFLLESWVGFIVGLALWICTMQRFSHRAQLYRYLTEPYIPGVSECTGKIFDRVYAAVGKPHRPSAE